jgi:hypothetical protein
MEPVSKITFCLSYLGRFTTHLLDPIWGSEPPVGVRVPTIDVFYVDGGRSWISSSGTSQGGRASMFLSIDGGRSSTSQGARCQCFLALMVGAPGSPPPAPPRGPIVNVFYIEGGRSRISISTHQGARLQCFFALMVGAPGSPTPAPPRGPPSTYVDGGRSWISVSTHQGPCHQRFFVLMVGAPESSVPPPKGPATNVLQLSGSHS